MLTCVQRLENAGHLEDIGLCLGGYVTAASHYVCYCSVELRGRVRGIRKGPGLCASVGWSIVSTPEVGGLDS